MKFSFKNILFYVVFIISIILIYGVYDYILNGRIVESFEQKYDDEHLLEFYKKYDIKINKENNTLMKNDKVVNYKNMNPRMSVLFSKNKANVSELLYESKMPVCKMMKWDNSLSNVKNIKSISNELKFPLIIKPVTGVKGNSVFTDIYDNNSLVKGIKILRSFKGEFNLMIEEQEFGDKFRILVLNQQVIAVRKESCPIITGNGRSNIAKLIQSYHILNGTKPIVHINEDLILQQGYSVEDVLEKGKQIKVTNIISVDNGSKDEFLDIKTVNGVNLKMFSIISKLLKLNICDIDYVTKNINIPYTISGKVIDINNEPIIDKNLMSHKENTDRFANALFSEKRFN